MQMWRQVRQTRGSVSTPSRFHRSAAWNARSYNALGRSGGAEIAGGLGGATLLGHLDLR